MMQSDLRAGLRRAFLAGNGWEEGAALQSDASHRRYYRLRRGNATAMLMDAPPGLEDAAAFVRVTRHLQGLGVRVPAIYAADVAAGFVLLEDLGDATFTRLLADGHNEGELYSRAVSLLARLHARPDAVEIELPEYNADVAIDEASLFTEWYLPTRLRRAVSGDAVAEFAAIWRAMFAELPALPPALVLRDFHVDNLMLPDAGDDGCAVLDYQDALIGSPIYDLVSLLEDARRDVSPALAREMLALYRARSSAAAAVSTADLHQHYIVWGAQRHCKVAGIFTRLHLRDGKDGYLQHLPRVLGLLRRNLHLPALAGLREWLRRYML